MLYARKTFFVCFCIIHLEKTGSKAEDIFHLVIWNVNQVLLVFIAL